MAKSSARVTASKSRRLPKKPKIPRSPRPNELTQVNLRHERASQAAVTTARFVAIGALITAIVLGSIQQVYTIKTRTVFGNIIDPDLQLAAVSLVNKIMDMLVTKTLENFAGIILTIAMTTPYLLGRQLAWIGASLEDFELRDELIKPQHSIAAFHKRRKNFGWRNADWMRFVTTLTISLCVLLQGLAINTVGYPKEPWYPYENIPSPVKHPVPRFTGQGMDWMTFQHSAWTLVGNGNPSCHVADAFIVSQAFSAFSQLLSLMKSQPYGWQQFDSVSNNGNFPALDTRYTGSDTGDMAVQEQLVAEIFQYLHDNGDRNAKAAKGWTGNLTLEVPSATVSCGPYRELNGTGSVIVEPISPNHNASATFSMAVTPLASLDFDHQTNTIWPAFAGATCDITFARVLYPFGMWITKAETADVSVTHYGKVYDAVPIISAFSPIDNTIAKALAIHTQATTARLETLTYNYTAAELFLASARNLQVARPEYASDTEALSPVLAFLINQLLAIGNWNTTLDLEHQITSEPIRWQLYGSGPRLGWEWLSFTVLVVLLVAMLASLVFSLIHRAYPGEWLKPGGMLIAANTSPTMSSLRDPANMDNEKNSARLRFFVKRESLSSKNVFLTDDNKAGEMLDPKGKYRWPQQTVEFFDS